jgi:hypothetical protein
MDRFKAKAQKALSTDSPSHGQHEEGPLARARARSTRSTTRRRRLPGAPRGGGLLEEEADAIADEAFEEEEPEEEEPERSRGGD